MHSGRMEPAYPFSFMIVLAGRAVMSEVIGRSMMKQHAISNQQLACWNNASCEHLCEAANRDKYSSACACTFRSEIDTHLGCHNLCNTSVMHGVNTSKERVILSKFMTRIARNSLSVSVPRKSTQLAFRKWGGKEEEKNITFIGPSGPSRCNQNGKLTSDSFHSVLVLVVSLRPQFFSVDRVFRHRVKCGNRPKNQNKTLPQNHLPRAKYLCVGMFLLFLKIIYHTSNIRAWIFFLVCDRWWLYVRLTVLVLLLRTGPCCKKLCDNNKVPRMFVWKYHTNFICLFFYFLQLIKHSAPLFLDFVGPLDAIVPLWHCHTHQDCKQQSTHATARI